MKLLAVRIDQLFQPAQTFPTAGSLVSVLVFNVYVVAGVLLLVLLIFGGFTFIIGAGQDDPRKVDQGKKAVTYAVVGFLVVFASYWIVQIIQVMTGVPILNSTR